MDSDCIIPKCQKSYSSPSTSSNSEPRVVRNIEEEESTDIKLALLFSLYPNLSENEALDILVSYEGCVEAAVAALEVNEDSKHKKPTTRWWTIEPSPTKKRCLSPDQSFPQLPPPSSTSSSKQFSSFKSSPRLGNAVTPSSIQTSLSSFKLPRLTSSGFERSNINVHNNDISKSPTKPLVKKGKTLYLYSPEDIAQHTPCTIIHNFLPAEESNALLSELIDESKTFTRPTFQLFDNHVQSPHTTCFYVATDKEIEAQTKEYVYSGSYVQDVRRLTARMQAVSDKVRTAVNDEIQKRIRDVYLGGEKLRYQSSKEWLPNCAFVNCYAGPSESVGYHSDQLTYLGPRAVIGSLSLGVAREFRVRKVVAQDGNGGKEEEEGEEGEEGEEKEKGGEGISKNGNERDDQRQASKSPLKRKPKTAAAFATSSYRRADLQGQISIHLPHNSLLVMHAEMQEEWKHSIPTVQTISPHPIAGNRRINITYRWYRESLHPHNTPCCRCGIPTVLRCVQRRQETRGRYMWMCYAGYIPGNKGCSFFQWADFDDDGEPIWKKDNG
jgi:alkylated DNA repair dioxygenase AlkB